MLSSRRRFSRQLTGFALGTPFFSSAVAAAVESEEGKSPEPDAAESVPVFVEPHMGCLWTLRLPGAEKAEARKAATAVFAEIERLNGIFSDYLPDSELSRLCRTAGSGQKMPVSGELFHIITESLKIAEDTSGLFDITLGPFTRLWRESRRTRRLPAPEALAKARAACGWQNVRMDQAARTVSLTKPEMQLDLGGIAKGWTADACLKLLREKFGITCALLDGTGQVTAGQPPPGREHWNVQLQAPREAETGGRDSSAAAGLPQGVKLKPGSVATAGDYFQSVEIDGVHYSHIIDPATGLGLTSPVQASVIAPTGLQADALDTVLCLMGAEKGLAWLETRHPEAQACVTETNREGKPATRATAGFWTMAIRGS